MSFLVRHMSISYVLLGRTHRVVVLLLFLSSIASMMRGTRASSRSSSTTAAVELFDLKKQHYINKIAL